MSGARIISALRAWHQFSKPAPISRALTLRRNALPERGRASRAYVERWHDARIIAKRLIGDYEAILRERESRGGRA